MAIINTRIALRNDTAANWENNSNVVLLKGEAGIEFDETTGKVKMKIGDGSTMWASLPYFGGDADVTAAQVFQADIEGTETDLEAIARVVGDAELAEGDIAIVKSTTAEKTFHTAYVYDNGVWAAMDGNYNAENVYFDEDLLTTTAIGNITLTNGQATIASTGKNLKEVWEAIFVKEQSPKTTQPAVSFSIPNKNTIITHEVGSSVTVAYNASLSAGSYTYGPATGVTATGWTAVLKNGSTEVETLETASGTFASVTMTDGDVLSVTATATHEDGTIPVTNRGNAYTAGQIKAGSKSATCSYKHSCYRNSFYGTLAAKEEPTSDVIRNLANKSGKALTNGTEFTFDVPVGALRTVIAYPATLDDLEAIKDNNDSMSNIIPSFTKTTVSVQGANGYAGIDYKVYYIDYANPNDAANKYTVII